MERLDKFLVGAGVGSRSQVKVFLKAGRISVSGIPEKDGGRKIDPAWEICMDGAPVSGMRRVVLMLNKPEGYVTSTEDPRDRTVMELLPDQYRKLDVKPVGRLDKATEGLLLFTNDGDLLHRLIAPKKEVPKIYYARHEGTADEEDVQAFRDGLVLRDGTKCLPSELRPMGPGESMIAVYEGKYHQVRRMMAARGHTVTYLERRQEAELTLEGLERGQCRELTPEEIGKLDK